VWVYINEYFRSAVVLSRHFIPLFDALPTLKNQDESLRSARYSYEEVLLFTGPIDAL
jgi:hypothetical protein